ncbi:MAG TPA: hypothetical protein VK582_21545 [Pyrinomonadaceae bacterium]|nr:hypothetical protein [Pyrinomonadaceae bacterium]
MLSQAPCPRTMDSGARASGAAIGSAMLAEIAGAMSYAHSYNEISKEGITE